MPTIEFTYETNDDPREIIERILDPVRIEREIEDVLNESSRLAEQMIRIYAPHGRTGELERHVSSTHAHHGLEPGEYEARAGVTRIEGDPSAPQRAKFPEIGTGLYGPLKKMIRPLSGRFMVFEIDGRKIVTTRVKGQRPQHYVRDAYRDLEEYLPQRLHLMAERIVAGGRQVA